MSTHDNTTQDVILIVDDDPVIRLLLAETLQQAGFSVCEAENGEEALHYFHETPPGLILLDVDMPDMDGFEVCRRIRTVSSYIPVIMVTGMEDLASIRQAYESGATDFINKPIHWPVLPHRIRYALRGAQTMQALAWTEARNSAILEAIPDSIVMLDSQGRLLDYQAGREDGTFSHPVLFLGRPFAEVLPAKAADCFMETIKLSLAQPAMRLPTARFTRCSAT
jgi:DNA-binding response OmpR family regulator